MKHKRMKRRLNSFRFALRGIWYAVSNESHLRFHIIAAVYVLIFAGFYDLSATRWAVLALLIAAVIAAEIFNTALERLCDLETDGYEPLVRIAKDAAAGAVLVLSVCAIIVAVLFFWNTAVITRIFFFFLERPLLAVLLVMSVVLSAAFVALGPKGIYKFFKR